MFHPKIIPADVLVAGAGHDELTVEVENEEVFARKMQELGIDLQLVREILTSLTVLRKSDLRICSAEEGFAAGVLDGLVMGIRIDRAARARYLGEDAEA